MVIAGARALKLFACIVDGEEHLGVEALITEFAVEALNEAVLEGLPGTDEIEFHAVLVRPGVQRPARKLGAVVDVNCPLRGQGDGWDENLVAKKSLPENLT
jgi:hypothetical protein